MDVHDVGPLGKPSHFSDASRTPDWPWDAQPTFNPIPAADSNPPLFVWGKRLWDPASHPAHFTARCLVGLKQAIGHHLEPAKVRRHEGADDADSKRPRCSCNRRDIGRISGEVHPHAVDPHSSSRILGVLAFDNRALENVARCCEAPDQQTPQGPQPRQVSLAQIISELTEQMTMANQINHHLLIEMQNNRKIGEEIQAQNAKLLKKKLKRDEDV